MKLNDYITITFPEVDAEDYDNPFLLEIESVPKSWDPLLIEMYTNSSGNTLNLPPTIMKCKVGGIWIEFCDQETVRISSYGTGAETMINIIRELSKSFGLEYLLSALETYDSQEEDSFVMSYSNENDALFEHFRKMFEQWLHSVGAQADPKSFDHLDSRLSGYLTALRTVVFEEFGLRIFSPNN